MSRIMEILARAERDGTARRTQSGLSDAPPLPTGGDALDAPFFPPVAPGADLAPPRVGSTDLLVPPASHPELVEPRTARATLHPALVAAIDPQSSVAEEYRSVRTRLMLHEDASPLRVVMVTSPGGGEGKSITTANLALTMAQEFQRSIMLVDADLREPAVHQLFGIPNTPGLSDVLNGDVSLDEALVYLPDFRLTVLPAGSVAHFPTELLGSTTMRRTIDTLRGRFDRVLLDLPPVLPLADVGTVAPLADGVLMVVRAGATQRPALDEALAAFDEDRVIGIVLNDTH